MARRDYVIGIDCSTTATKAVVWDEWGIAVAEGRATFEISSPQPDWGEQNAEDWWESTKTALRRATQVVDPGRIGAIGITHQRETFVCLNEDGHPIRPAILWLDSRPREEVARYGSEEVHRITGKPPNPTPGFYKMLWLKEHEPNTLERAAKVVDVHAFLVHRMTGHWRTSWAAADPLGLVDMESFDYSDELLGMVGLGREQVCGLYAPGDVIGELKDDVASEVGLPAGLPVVSGVGDGQAAGLGANITEPGRAYLNLGTGIVSGTYSESYSYGDEYRVLSGPVPKTYTLETLLAAGTYTVSWFCEKFADVNAGLGLGLSAEQILETAAAQLEPGSEGLLAVPYWNNALMPYWDFDARGIMVGWTGVHGKAHVYRAILEGIAFEQRLMTDGAERSLEKPIEHVVALGGGSRSSLWCQILADVMRRPISVAREAESTCLGAGMLAAAASGMHGGIKEAAEAMSGEGERFEPDEGRAARYDRLYGVYNEIYPSLRPLFPKLTDALEDGSA